MNTTQKAFLFYLPGVGSHELGSLAPAHLLQSGASTELVSAPPVFPEGLKEQALSACLPASTGFFDTLMPAWSFPNSALRASAYAIGEQQVGRAGASRWLLPDQLRMSGWSVDIQEVTVASLAQAVETMAHSQENTPVCNIIQLEITSPLTPSSPTALALSEALLQAHTWVGEEGVLAVFSPGKAPPVRQFVNVNNFLAQMDILEHDEESGQIIWENTLAYYAGHGHIFLNLIGRDPQGAVHPQEEQAEIRDTLIRALPLKLRDTSGESVIERIFPKEEVYNGDYLFCAPDLVVVFRPGFAPSPNSMRLAFDESIFTTPAAGTHSLAGVNPATVGGFLLAYGPVLQSGVSLSQDAPLVGAVPSVLHALGISAHPVDGEAIAELFQRAYLEEHPLTQREHDYALSAEDEELVIERLRNLGYL